MKVEEVKYEFDSEFQTAIVALLVRDLDFVIRTDGLIKPDYFETQIEATIVALWLEYFSEFRRIPENGGVIKEIIKKALVRKMVRPEMLTELSETLANLSTVVIADKDYVCGRVVEFARHQAITQAILDSVDLVERGEFDKVEKLIRQANEVGMDDRLDQYDYFDESAQRKTYREDIIAGKVKKDGIPTGIEVMDALLYHNGWGRRELSIIMGGAKSGKTTMLIDCARAASLAKYRVLYVSLEVASKIIAERLDANIAEIPYHELGARAEDVHFKLESLKADAGTFKIHEYPSGTLTPKTLNRLISRYESMGTKFDLVVVDYADLMVPDFRMNDVIENSKRVYVDLRAIAQEHNVAMLTATQTNREGMKQAVADMTHISDDINKARTCDILISINQTEDEKLNSEARLYFAASRNQAGARTIRVKQALERGKFIAKVMKVD